MILHNLDFQATRSKTDARKKSSEKCCVSKKSSTGTTSTKVAPPTTSNGKVAKTTTNGDTKPILTSSTKEESEINQPNAQARLGLARLLKQKQQESETKKDASKTVEIEELYHDVIKMAPSLHDAYIELGELLAPKKPLDAIDVYCKFPFAVNSTSGGTSDSTGGTDEGNFDDGFLYGEIVRLLMKEELYDDPRLKHNMIKLGQILGFTMLDKYVSILENKLKFNKLLCEVYAGVNGKSVDDPDLKQFFRFKCWE